MTRENKIERTAEKYAEGSPNAILIYRAFKDGVRYADKHPAKKQVVTIDAWVARNWTGLYLYEIIPKSKNSYRSEYDFVNHIRIGNCKNIFKNIKDIDEGGKPQKVKVTIELEEE